MDGPRTAPLQDRYLRRVPLPEGGFRYLRPDGRVYRSRAGLARIAALAVPPAYTEVYVSPDPEATLQAFGRDARGRLQYRYHPDFLRQRALAKWRRLARFAAALPGLRARVAADLRRAGLPRPKVLALLARLLERAYLRVGSPSYTRRYRSYGLTTLRKRHVQVEGCRVAFRYRGKHGVEQRRLLRDRGLAGIVGRLLELPGGALFQYLDEEGGRHPVRAEDLNAYLREAMGPFTTKDFRSWGGTLEALEFLLTAGPPQDERSGGRTLAQCVRAVAARLGNTPAVTRGSYICPVLFDLYLAGRVVGNAGAGEEDNGLSPSEAALQRILALGLGPQARPPGPRSAQARVSGPASPRVEAATLRVLAGRAGSAPLRAAGRPAPQASPGR